MVGVRHSNADSGVTLFGGRVPFHGTNPLAFAVPSGGARPWLLDMATSSIPFNRVLLYRVLGNGLPRGVAADADGRRPGIRRRRCCCRSGARGSASRAPRSRGWRRSSSAALQGATLDHAMIPMVGGEDMATPRGMGHFCLAIEPGVFGGREAFAAGMAAYLAALRGSPAREGEALMAPGDREWRVEAERERGSRRSGDGGVPRILRRCKG